MKPFHSSQIILVWGVCVCVCVCASTTFLGGRMKCCGIDSLDPLEKVE